MNHRKKEKVGDGLPLPALSSTYSKGTYQPSSLSRGYVPIVSFVKDKLQRLNWRILSIFLILWVIVIHYFERIQLVRAMKSCQWEKWERWDKVSQPHRIALIADPQIVDAYSYEDRPDLINYFTKKISDNYLYRNHKFMQEKLDPDTTIFLGDLFDGGRECEHKVWFEEYKRFNQIFPKKINRRTIMSLPGNHDIGFEDLDPKVLTRFAAFFGEPNDFIELGNHSIILLDTISLSSSNPEVSSEPKEFLKSINGKLNPKFPRILLTHVPLYRFSDKQTCGPHRESSKPFPVQKGRQYQTVIDLDISQTILNTIRPSIIFAGDDHDYCDIQQPYQYNGNNEIAREITVKSAAMTSGIKYPAIQLLSLNNPYYDNFEATTEAETFETELCYLPSSYFALKSYIFTFVGCLLFLILYFLYPGYLIKFIHIFKRIIKHNPQLPRFNDSRWKPHTNEVLMDINIERNPPGFIINGISTILIIYLLFGIYYKYI